MQLDSRPLAPHPYTEALPQLPPMPLTSQDMTDGSRLDRRFTGEGEDISPQLSWSGAPSDTKSFVVSCFDPDAPTPSGYWHWCLVDIPADVTQLPRGAGNDPELLTRFTGGKAMHIRNDSGNLAYNGPMPPQGDREHRYCFAIHALKIPSLGLNAATATNAPVHFMSLFNGVARGTLTVTYQR